MGTGAPSSESSTSSAKQQEPPDVAAPGASAAAGQDSALTVLEDAEGEDEAVAAELASDEEVADSIAAQAVYGAASDPEAEMEANAEELEALEAAAAGQALPPAPVYDTESLCAKYGGLQRVLDDHRVAADDGYINEPVMEDLRFWLFDYVGRHNETARRSALEFEHERGSRLVLVGTNHLSRASSDFAREVVAAERPECLVLERRLGDDSLQRFTVPEELYQELAMAAPPGVLRSGDSPIERARKFQGDKIWLEATPGWRDIGGEAAVSTEMGAAFAEFARQRRPGAAAAGGPRGGTVCLGDVDLRDLDPRGMLPGLAELAEGASMSLRDLQFASAMRAALRTHSRVVGVVGKDHLAGIARLLAQDPRIRETKRGIEPDPAPWLKDLEDGGRKWEREAMGGSLFNRLAEVAEKSPFGTFLSADAVAELFELREETAARLRKDGPEAAEPAAPVSSELGASLFKRGQAFTPPDEEALRRWLAGGDVEPQDAGDFPFENWRLRSTAPVVPGTGFPEPPPE